MLVSGWCLVLPRDGEENLSGDLERLRGDLECLCGDFDLLPYFLVSVVLGRDLTGDFA